MKPGYHVPHCPNFRIPLSLGSPRLPSLKLLGYWRIIGQLTLARAAGVTHHPHAHRTVRRRETVSAIARIQRELHERTALHVQGIDEDLATPSVRRMADARWRRELVGQLHGVGFATGTGERLHGHGVRPFRF